MELVACARAIATELGFSFVDAGTAEAILAAKISDRDSCLMLLQDADDLFFRETNAPHVFGPRIYTKSR